MKTIIAFALFVLFVLFMGRTEISFSPFYIRMPGWQNVVGWLLLMFGVLFLNSNARQEGYEKGIEDAFNIVEELNKSYSIRKEETK